MAQKTPVPLLDLAPKLKRPLSLWNPLDYLRLLYWVFYFPQALRWYVDTFGGGYIPPKEMNFRKGSELLQQNTVQRNLLLQGQLLTFVTLLIFNVTLESIGVSINWVGVAVSMAVSVTFSVAECVAEGVAEGLVKGVAFSIVFGVGIYEGGFSFLMGGVAFNVAFGVMGGIAVGLAFSVMGGIAVGLALGVIGGILSVISAGILLVTSGVSFDIVFNLLIVSMLLGLAFALGVLRPESWLIGLCFNIPYLQKDSLLFLRVTSLPIPYLSVRLKKILQQDWEKGLYNANHLLVYTLQFIPVVQAVNQVLNNIPSEQIIYRVAQLAEETVDWNLVRFISANLNEMLKSEAIRGIFFLPVSWRQKLQNRFPAEMRFNTSARATAAGFWYLHEKEPVKAKEAFALVRPILYGEEMYLLAQTLKVFQKAENVHDIASVSVDKRYVASLRTSQGALLRPTTWRVISRLHLIVEDIRLVKHSVSRVTRAFAINRAQGKLTNILNNPEILPQEERGIIIDIAKTWQTALLQIAGEVGEVTITQPVRNPYIIGDPVMGEKFVGREEVMRQLEELWVMGDQLQSVVIYGHRRMGKTSILRNAANSVGSGIQVAYVNMLNAGNISEGVGEVLIAISDAVSEAVNVPPPDDEKLLKLPEITFKRYLKKVVETLHATSLHATSLRGLIIAIDEFEKIEELITEGKIPENFLGYLRGLLQINSKVAFAFAGLHTLEEMTADYFQPFFASVIPIHVGFMERVFTGQILANPIQFSDNATPPQEDFLLDYKPEALDKIYEFTHGQPYLVQLIGFVLVRRYNDQVFELGHKRDSVFTVEDVEAVINNTEFFKRGRYYFDGVWSQAKQGAQGQQAILRALAPHPKGLNYEDVIEEVSTEGFDEKSLKEAIKTLKNHDVVEENQGRLCIIVELFRRWLIQQM